MSRLNLMEERTVLNKKSNRNSLPYQGLFTYSKSPIRWNNNISNRMLFLMKIQYKIFQLTRIEIFRLKRKKKRNNMSGVKVN